MAVLRLFFVAAHFRASESDEETIEIASATGNEAAICKNNIRIPCSRRNSKNYTGVHYIFSLEMLYGRS